MTTTRAIRVLIAKPGLDGHDRGARVLTLGLRDEGMEVFYSGLRQTAEQIVEMASQRNVDVIGLSSLTDSHNILFPEVAALVKEKGLEKVLLIGGGLIPKEDVPGLQQKGIKAIFGPGTSIKKIADYIRENVNL